MSRLIDADSLYEKTAEWEARALAVIEKLNRKPFEEMDANEIAEWRKWSCILNERSAFKHDVADAPTVETQQWIPVTEQLPGYGEDVLVLIGGYCNVGHIVPTNDEKQYNWYYSGWYHDPYDVDAWMPLPEPWEGGAE